MASSTTRPRPHIRVERQTIEVTYAQERLSDEVLLELVHVPAGDFVMGSPEDEEGRYDNEGPQHHVDIPEFWMGQYPVTQAEWRVVAGFPKVERDLKLDPSGFKGDRRPVERVSWHEAVEFCDRLTQHTGRTYRLPSEAEWEYACRASTTTPFHFGLTLSAQFSNYDATREYGPGEVGEYRQETTPIDQFGVANGFGFCDMHGNVWEWCLDHWHKNYEGAPTDGSAWLSSDKSKKRVVRGGSWDFNPRRCRSASRNHLSPEYQRRSLGFRVVLAPR